MPSDPYIDEQDPTGDDYRRFIADHGSESWFVARCLSFAADQCEAPEGEPVPSWARPVADMSEVEAVEHYGVNVLEDMWAYGRLQWSPAFVRRLELAP